MRHIYYMLLGFLCLGLSGQILAQKNSTEPTVETTTQTESCSTLSPLTGIYTPCTAAITRTTTIERVLSPTVDVTQVVAAFENMHVDVDEQVFRIAETQGSFAYASTAMTQSLWPLEVTRTPFTLYFSEANGFSIETQEPVTDYVSFVVTIFVFGFSLLTVMVTAFTRQRIWWVPRASVAMLLALVLGSYGYELYSTSVPLIDTFSTSFQLTVLVGVMCAILSIGKGSFLAGAFGFMGGANFGLIQNANESLFMQFMLVGLALLVIEVLLSGLRWLAKDRKKYVQAPRTAPVPDKIEPIQQKEAEAVAATPKPETNNSGLGAADDGVQTPQQPSLDGGKSSVS